MSISFHKVDENGIVGNIDYLDHNYAEPIHKFAFIAEYDWFKKTGKGIGDRFTTIAVKLKTRLLNNGEVDLVTEKRKIGKQAFDYLIKVDDVAAFGY